MSDHVEKIQPELSDLLEMLNRYMAVNKNDVCILFNIVGYKKSKDGSQEGLWNEEASRIGAYGDINTLRVMLNDLRDIIEDEKNEDDFVDI